MVNYRKILELYFSGISQRTISPTVGSTRRTIREVISRAEKKGVTKLTEDMANAWIQEYLFPEKKVIIKGYFPADGEFVHKELMKKNVTLKLLHLEYEATARNANKIPYAYRSFCYQYGEYAKKFKLTMPIRRKPGEILEVDWAGSTLHIVDRDTGEKVKAYIFIAPLPYSQYSYVEAFLDMKSSSWITAHIHAFEFFDGVTESVVPDNLKTGVTSQKKYDVILNEAYREFADYYHTVIIPTRVRAPKDKPSVEGTVGFISRQLIAALRNAHCFSIQELNGLIKVKLDDLNNESFQKRPRSRKQVYDEEEYQYLAALPSKPFKLSEWRTAKVQLNYHIQIDRMYYSVPFEYVQNQVDVRLTRGTIEIYFNEVRIASHKRLYGEFGQYATLTSHMPENHRKFLKHTPQNSLKWAESVGPNTVQIVELILANTVEKQALNMIMGLKNLSKYYSSLEIEQACGTVGSVSKNPTVSLIKTVLKRMKTDKNKNKLPADSESKHDYGFTRGAGYFKGVNNYES